MAVIILLTAGPSTLGMHGYQLRAGSLTTHEKLPETLLLLHVACGTRPCQCPGEHISLRAGLLHIAMSFPSRPGPGAPLSRQHCQKALHQLLRVSIFTSLERSNRSPLPKRAQCTQVSSSCCSHHRYADLPLPTFSSWGTHQSRFYSTQGPWQCGESLTHTLKYAGLLRAEIRAKTMSRMTLTDEESVVTILDYGSFSKLTYNTAYSSPSRLW